MSHKCKCGKGTVITDDRTQIQYCTECDYVEDYPTKGERTMSKERPTDRSAILYARWLYHPQRKSCSLNILKQKEREQ